MEVGTEISQKIRSAIKAKLMELGAYVDDELPDYIMVMVANKKNKSQMKNDLSLFLGNNTDAFTTWLHGLLGKLQTITVDSGKGKAEKSKVSKEKKKSKDGKSSKSDSSKKAEKKGRKRKSSHDNTAEGSSRAKIATTITESEAPVSGSREIIPEATSGDNHKTVETEGSETSSKQSRHPDADNTAIDPVIKESNAQEDVEDVRQLLVSVTPGDDLAQELDAVEEEVVNSQSSQKIKTITESRATKESKENAPKISGSSSSALKVQEQKLKRKLPSSVVATVNRDQDEEEYDPFNPAVGNVASVVKVTSRKATVPPSMQANRALLVKAMSEAEKSVATKKKVAVTRPMNRNDSPVEYSPKRKQPSGSGKRASPPPYIPSKKMRSDEISQEQSSRSVKQKRTLSKDDVRHTLGRDSSHRGRIISASRKEELLKAMGISKAKVASGVPLLTHGPTRKIEAGSDSIKGKSDRTTEGGSYARQVRGEDAQAGGIKNLQITARVGPMRAIQHASSDAQKSSLSPEVSKASLQFTIVAGHSKSRKGGGKDEPETASERSVQRDAREDIQAARKGKAVSAPAYKAGGRVLTKLARDAVQKQCQAAVMSVKKMPVPTSKSKSARHESPDSRVVRCDRESPVNEGTDVLEDEDSNDVTEVVLDTDSDRAASADSEPSKKVSVVQRKSPSSEPESLTELASLEEEKADTEDVEDLSRMLEGEDLDSQLLLKEEEDKNDLNLDLDDEDLSHVVDDVNVSIEEEGAQSKSSTRFIVTLDGVDVAQFEEDNSGKSIPALAEPQAQPTFLPPPNPSNPLPVATLMPNSSSQPAVAIANPHPQRLAHTLLQPVAHTVPQPLPQILPQPMAQPLPLAPIQASAPSQVATKPRPPKIQPFSISLRDSDDEHEEKIVTYVQAGDITAAGSVSVTDDAGDDLTSLQRARQQERCRFWPACMAGTECQYHHPTTHCKTFPNCKFGDKCLFIHPNCRFDSKCVRPDCPFTHSSKRRLPQAVVTTIHAPRHYPRFPPAAPQAATVCHYFPNCLNPSCTFVHPKPCMYGASCKNPGCAFYHPVVQSANVGNLKWQAQVSSQSVVNKSSTPGTKTTTVSS